MASNIQESEIFNVVYETTSSRELPLIRYNDGEIPTTLIPGKTESIYQTLKKIWDLKGSARTVIVELTHLGEKAYVPGTAHEFPASFVPKEGQHELHYRVKSESSKIGERLTFEAHDEQADKLNLDSGKTMGFLVSLIRRGTKSSVKICLVLTPALFVDGR